MTTQTQDFATEQDLDKLFEELDMLGEMHSTPAEQPSAPAAEPQPQVVQQTVTAPSPQPQAVPEPPVQQVITPEPTPVASTPQAMFANFNVGGMLKHAEGKVELEPETQTPPPQQQTTLQPPVPERVDNDADQKVVDQIFATTASTPSAAPANTSVVPPIATAPKNPQPIAEQAAPSPAQQTSAMAQQKRATGYVGKLGITLENLKYKPDVHAFQIETAISDVTIDQCMTAQPSLMAYWSAQQALADHQQALAKRQLEHVEATLFQVYRKSLIKAGEKPTERLIDAYIRRDPTWELAYDVHATATQYANIHKGNVFALVHRRDMLIQRGSSLRAELQGQMRILNQDNHNDDSMAAVENAARSLNRTYTQ
ncbi:hypothetical protein MW722_001521 [Acinetobacter baumannii]|uniref:Uncharacterized protein n=7 Tax=Acinetobacter baumannii TaxID=470 RepID=A0AAN6AJI3_ACIBA|nr:hypothetical protein [Acinetobacter baumannii]EMT94615.1 hypothetical protein ABNIH5_00370 [Acinetobacter baumannii ABNIH5]ETY66931.1 hypothetical protein X964_18465 [Acinetobacter baumannii MDR_MMC4]EXB15662.1 hypothetical protein J513_0402 [Acinetobacter baumannii 1397084]EXD24113.1 hypothetical protein J480_2083 [Acinetobacter baumannii 34654]EYD11720.1 hypothetical protein J935_1561 [Acinetobacter baumannii 44362_2]EYU47017.1 hypothetical protein J616_04057 [Acinetobacter baumannii 145